MTMASFNDYWKRLQGRNAGLEEDATVMRISVAAFRKSLEQAYGQGSEDRKRLHEAVEKLGNLGGGKSSFKDLFGL